MSILSFQRDQTTAPGARIDLYTKTMLTAIALLLAVLAFQPFREPDRVQAQSDYSFLYIEPGTTALRDPDGSRQFQGKVFIDRRNGDVWGFPTDTSAPYPVNLLKQEPPVSRPLYLGRFEFSAMTRE